MKRQFDRRGDGILRDRVVCPDGNSIEYAFTEDPLGSEPVPEQELRAEDAIAILDHVGLHGQPPPVAPRYRPTGRIWGERPRQSALVGLKQCKTESIPILASALGAMGGDGSRDVLRAALRRAVVERDQT